MSTMTIRQHGKKAGAVVAEAKPSKLMLLDIPDEGGLCIQYTVHNYGFL